MGKLRTSDGIDLHYGGINEGGSTFTDGSRNVTMATGASAGKFAVMSTSVHGSYDLYNNGTSYFNGGVTVDDALSVTGASAQVSVNGHIYLTGNVDRRIKLGDSGTSGASTSNNAVYVRGNDDHLILNCAGNGHISFTDNGAEGMRLLNSNLTVYGTVKGNGYYPANTTSAVGYYGYNNTNMVVGVNGAAYYYGSDGADYGIVIQGAAPICRQLKIGTVNAGTTVIDSGRNLVNITSATFSNDVAINNGSPELYFGTTGNHYNWRIAAQENVNAAFEISVGSQDTNYANDTYTTKFHITNSGTGTFAGDVVAYSDERLKTNIQTLDGKKALQMRGVSFEKDGEQSSGVIAQELEKIAPELVKTAEDEMGTKSVAYGNLVGYLIEAVKDQQKEIEYMKLELKLLKENNNGD